MIKLLEQLREEIIIHDNDIQFKLDDSYYELIRNKDGEWNIINVFGDDLDLNVSRLKNKSVDEVKKILKRKFKDSAVQIY